MSSEKIEPYQVILKAGREHPIRRYHPWVFSGAVAESDSRIREGDIVEVYSSDKQFLGVGFWNGAGIAVKMLSIKKRPIDYNFWYESFLNSLYTRTELGLIDSKTTNAFRICNGEGDGLPGLIIDLYATTAVVQFHAAAIVQRQQDIKLALIDAYQGRIKSVVCKEADEDNQPDSSASTEILENGMRFLVDFQRGQKTGFFLDQRDNRQLVRDLSKGKNVLNAFSYTGGFSIAALQGGAFQVKSVDTSAHAIQMLESNLSLNSCGANHQSVCSDYFDYLKGEKDSFDLIVLDPPAFTKHRDSVEAAVKGYANLNQQTMLRLKPGGLLLTFSCSQLVNREQFRDAVSEGAYRSGKQFRILRELQAAACHPHSLSHREGAYLKGLLLRLV